MSNTPVDIDYAQLAAEELLDTHEGSLYVMSNLYVRGRMYGAQFGGNVAFTGGAGGGVDGVVSFCNDIDMYGDNFNFHREIQLSNAEPMHYVGAPVDMQNESVYISNLVVGDVTFSRALAAPVFPASVPAPATPADVLADVTSVYDGQWTLTQAGVSNVAADDVGALLGNGKVALQTAFDGVIGVRSALLGAAPVFARGTYVNNVLPAFNPFGVRLFRNDDDPAAPVPELVQQSLTMNTGILSGTYNVIGASAFENVGVSVDVMALRHLPFCSLMTLKVRPRMDVSYVDLYVEMAAPQELREVQFNSATMHNPLVDTAGVYMLTGVAKAGAAADTTMACALTAVPDVGYQLINMGFNVYRRDSGRCFNKFRLVGAPGAVTLANGVDVAVHLLAANMSSQDFDEPLDEAKRVLLTVISRDLGSVAVPADPAAKYVAAIQRARDAHVSAWNKMWATTLNVCPRADATPSELADTALLRRYVRYTLYNLYSCVRDAGYDPDQVPLLDLNGQFVYEADLWLTPLLIFVRSEVARAVIEYRHTTLAQAQQLAAAFGFKGAKYPASADVVGYKAGMYWDARASLSLYNSALVSVHAWNYYRISGDKEWLQSKGYPVMRGVANFIVSAASQDATTPTLYHLDDTVGLLGDETSSDNAMTVNLCTLALRYASEASYELTLPARAEWSQVALGLVVPTFPTDRDKIRYDRNALETVVVNVAEPLHVLLPPYSTNFFSVDNLRSVGAALLANTTLYENRVDADWVAHPFNQGLVSFMYALLAQHQTSPATYTVKMMDGLRTFLQAHASGAWGNLKEFGARTSTTPYDLNSGALLLLVLMQGLGGMIVQGGVTETRFYYEEMKILANKSAYMPVFLREIQAVNMGPNRTTARVLNRLERGS